MANQDVTIRMRVLSDFSDAKGDINQLSQYLSKLKMPANTSASFEKTFDKMKSDYTQLQALMSKGIKTKSDLTTFERLTSSIQKAQTEVKELFGELSSKHLKLNVNMDIPEIKQAKANIEELKRQLNEKINTQTFSQVEQQIKNLSSIAKTNPVKDLKTAFESLNLSKAQTELNNVVTSMSRMSGAKEGIEAVRKFQQAFSQGDMEAEELSNTINSLPTDRLKQVATYCVEVAKNLKSIDSTEIERIQTESVEAQKALQQLENTQMSKATSEMKQYDTAIDNVSQSANELLQRQKQIGQDSMNMTSKISELRSYAEQFFSVTSTVMLARRALQQTLETVKELDKAMSETAVVTDFNIGDMWDALPKYTQAANELGATTLGAYQTMTLFYQQGLDTNEVFEIGTETMKMARIAGLEYADATNLMTAALRGFNMELNEASATRINDVYSELAAITAADTNEIATAMTKTASIASNANMEFETTAALLSQIIETTREPAETAGTAMKTIIARFTEMKKSASEIVNVEGEEINVNKVEAALRDAGVALRDVNGEFRDLDDVFLELSSKWNGLDKMTQRYVATMAAGSRQQSRFIAMMQDYDRTMELVNAAYNSEGSSETQFGKTQESLESKINKLTNAWNEFLMGITNSSVIKAGIDLLTGLLNVVNDVTDIFGEGAGGVLKFATAIGTLFAASKLSNKALIKISDYMTSIKEMNQVRRTGTLLNGAQASAEQRAAAMSGNRKFFSASAQKPSRWQRIINKANQKSETEQAVINATRQRQISETITQKQSQIDGWRQSQSSMYAGGRLTPELDAKFTKDIEKANTEIRVLQGQLKALQTPTQLNIMTDEARAKVAMLERELDARPMDTELKLQLDEAKLQLEAFEQLQEMDDINVPLDVDATKGDIKVAVTKERWDNPVTVPIVPVETPGTGTHGPIDRIKERFQEIKEQIKNLPPKVKMALAVVTAAVVATIAAVYATWYNSGLQVSKRLAEAQAGTLENTRAQTEALTTEIQELEEAWTRIQDGEDYLKGLIEGTVEWTQKIQELNSEVQALTEKYSDLYDYITIDTSSGQWVLSEEGYQTYLNLEQEKLTESTNRQLFQQALSNYYTALYEAGDAAAAKDYLWNWQLQQDNVERRYAATLQKAFKMANEGQTKIDGTDEVDKLDSEILKDILSDTKTRKYIEELDDDETWLNFSGLASFGTIGTDFLINGKDSLFAHADPRAALEYYDELQKAEQLVKTEEDAYVRNYLASSGLYGATTQEAVANVMYQKEGAYKTLERDQENRSTWWALGKYDGKTGGAGARMRGEANDQGESVEAIMESLGYELIDSSKNHYKHKTTGQLVNVDAVGGGAADEKTKDVDGEEMQVWSNEYVRELGRQEAIRKGVEKEIDALANEFSENEELAKMVAGDLSANLDELADDYSNEFFDVKTFKESFKKSRQEQMKEIADRYGISFTSTETNQDITKYSQQAYELAEAAKQFEKNAESMGEITAQNLTTIYLLLSQDEEAFTFTSEEDISHLEKMSNYLNEAGVSASNLQDFVGKIDTSSAINGARQLNKYLEEGGKNAALSTMVKTLDETGENLFSLENQFKEMVSNEQWIEETQSALTEIYKLEGKITADNIRELAEKNSDLATVLETNSLKASGFAKMMEAVEEGSLSLGQVTTDLIKIYDQLYYSVDLAGEAIARLESVEIGDSDTKIGNIYSESWAAVKDLIERGAYGDSQIDDYMNQMIGEIAWNEALSTAEGNKVKAYTAIDKEYGLSKNQGNLYGSWSALMKNNDNKNSLAGGAITMDANGIINYDLSDIKNTQELVDKIVKETGVVKEYAETMVADMKTYSKTFGSDLEDLDKRGTLDSFLDSRVTQDGKLIASDVELSAFSKAYGQSLEEFKDNLFKNVTYKDKTGKTQTINKIEDRKYSETGSYYTTTDEAGNKKFSLTNKEFTDSQIQSQMDNFLDGQDWSKEVRLNFTDLEGNDLTSNYIASLLNVDAIRDIVLNPEMPKDEKMQHLKTILKGHFDEATTNGLVEGLTSEEAATKAATLAANTGDDVYNKVGGALYEACNVLNENPVTIPLTFSGMTFTIPENIVTKALGIGGKSFTLGQKGTTKIEIGGEGTGMNMDGGGGFKPRTSSSPITDLLGDVDSSGLKGNTEGGKGTAYNEKHDEDNTGKDSGSGGGSEEENDTNPKVENLNTKLEALDRKLERREIDAVEHQFAQDALYLEKKMALQAQKNAAESEAKYLGKYYKYDAETDAYLYLENAYNNASDETKNKIDEEIDKLQGINDELNEIEDAIEDFEFKNPFDEERFYEAEGDKINSDNELAHIDRQRKENERYKELVGKMPSEVQGPLNLALTGADMFYESQEINANLNRKAALEQQMQAKYNDSDYYGKYYTWNERTQSFDIDSEALSDPNLKPKTRDAIMEEFEEMQGFAQEWRDVSDELSGGFIQDAFKEAGEAAEDLAISFINDGHAADNINDIFNRFEKKLGLNEKALDGFGNAIGDAIDSSELLDKTFKGFGVENVDEKINQSPIGGLLSDNQKNLLSLVGGEGGTFGELGASLGLNISDALGGIGNLLNFDMMSLGLDMFNGMMGIVDQGKQMVEKIIGYITQATQVIVDAWTNREDYLYNFLKVIEKHLSEYEKLQRYSTQLEKGRLTSSQDILNNWNEQWKSLQLQLEEQTERLETRQEELDRSRWNPFSLISGWDPTTDTLYENRSVKFAWDLIIGFGEAFAPFGTGAFFSQLNQLYEDYDQRVQNSYEDRLAAEQALLDIEDERLELVKVGSDEATEFENKILEAMVQKEQQQIDELTRLNDAITDANSKLISTLQDNLDKMRQDRENEKKEEELGEKERRLAYLRQDTSGANLMEIKKLEEELEEGHEDYTDTLIDQKISELEKQNELAAEQRQQQIDLLQGQLDYAEKYGLYWDAIYGMLYTIDENGNAVLNPENFDLDGNIRENSELAKMLGTFSDRMGMSVWSSVLDNEETKRLGRYYGAFIGMNGVNGDWANYWALKDPGANDPNYAQPEVEIPDGIWGVLYKFEMLLRERSINNNPDLINRAGRTEQAFKNFFGKMFGNDEWANYKYEYTSPAHVQPTVAMGMKETSDSIKSWFANGLSGIIKDSKGSVSVGGTQNNGDQNITNYFNIGTVGENISLDDMVDRVSSAIRGLFTSDGVGGLQKKR